MADQETPTAGMHGDVGDSPHDNALERLPPVFQSLDFQARHRQSISHGFRGDFDGHKLSQPLKAHTHRFAPTST
jgi:hypothetical protein